MYHLRVLVLTAARADAYVNTSLLGGSFRFFTSRVAESADSNSISERFIANDRIKSGVFFRDSPNKGRR